VGRFQHTLQGVQLRLHLVVALVQRPHDLFVRLARGAAVRLDKLVVEMFELFFQIPFLGQ
jgi:hypothetical protein